LPARCLIDFIREKHSMYALYEKMCVAPPEVKKIEEKLEKDEDVGHEEVEEYEKFQSKLVSNMDTFQNILMDNRENGFIFKEKGTF
jgi:hypothetical protein